MKSELENITGRILNSHTAEEEIECIRLLSNFFSKLTVDNYLQLQNEKQNEVILPGGIALSPLHATDCMNDYRRTAKFIKGTHLAIRELIRRFPAEKINILYAGCGPYATILLPLLPVFIEDEISVTFLDINEYSIVSVETLLSELGLKGYAREIIKGDAIVYKKQALLPLHLVVTETMFHALTREPQVAITANLAPQLVKDGILIPEEISLDMVFTFFAKERYFGNDNYRDFTDKNASLKEPERLEMGNIFTLTKENSFSDKVANNSFQFESTYYKTPEIFLSYPDACIFTKLKVFGDVELKESESLITNPYCVNSLYNIGHSTSFKLIYDFKNIPTWKYEI